MLKRSCKICNKSFFVVPSRIRYRIAIYCSNQCMGVGQQKGKHKNCLFCNKSFYSRPFDARRGFAKFCSIACSNRFQRKGIYIDCFQCGKKIYLMPSRIGKRNNGSFCSKACKNRYQKTGIKLSEEHKRKVIEGLAKRLIIFPTSIEKKLYDELQKRGLLFEMQKLINGKFVVDAYIPSLNLIIEADGDYWHSLDNIRKKDSSENAYLKKCGFNLLRLSGTEIENNKFKRKLWKKLV